MEAASDDRWPWARRPDTVRYVRLADRPSEAASIEITADADTVWRLVSDIDLPARFSDEYQGGEWLDGADGPALGARFRGHNRRGERAWTVTCTVTAYEPGRVFEWTVEDPDDPVARWRFSIEPGRDPGVVVLEQWCRMGTAPSGLTMAIDRHPERESQIVAGRMQRHLEAMTATIAGVKQLAEA